MNKEDFKNKEDFNLYSNQSNKIFGFNYTKEDMDFFEEIYNRNPVKIKEYEVVKGTVLDISNRDVIVSIGFKSDGLISVSEFKDIPDLKIGDEVDVYIEEQEDQKGQLILSRKKAKLVQGWKKIQDSLTNNIVIDGIVKRRTKGGLIVDVFGIESFLPGSQIDIKPIKDFDIFVNKKIELKVVKIKHSNDNVVVSHKVLIEKDLEKQKIEIINNLEKGQVLEGIIKNMTNFGVFIDLGGVDGLLHITDISWGRINHPNEILELGQKIKVVVIDFDKNKRRISLGMKQLIPHPWISISESIQVGFKLKGKVVNIADYGIFIEVTPGVEGLIHISEMSWSQHIRNPQDFSKVGDEIEAIVLTLDKENRKMSLGVKQLTEDPWKNKDLELKYAVGTIHNGIVKNIANFGVFIELEEGIDGLLHISDLSWTKKVKKPLEVIKLEDKVKTIVLEINSENKRLALGFKQLHLNPWNIFEKLFSINSIHKGQVFKIIENYIILKLAYGIFGFVPIFNKKNNEKIIIGKFLNIKVVETLKFDRKLLFSYL